MAMLTMEYDGGGGIVKATNLLPTGNPITTADTTVASIAIEGGKSYIVYASFDYGTAYNDIYVYSRLAVGSYLFAVDRNTNAMANKGGTNLTAIVCPSSDTTIDLKVYPTHANTITNLVMRAICID